MKSLREEIKSEHRIGKLKELASEVTQCTGISIPKISSYNLAKIGTLRKVLLSTLDKSTQEKSSHEDIHSISSLKDLKQMAKMLNISGYSKFTAGTKEELRQLIIDHIGDSKDSEDTASTSDIASTSESEVTSDTSDSDTSDTSDTSDSDTSDSDTSDTSDTDEDTKDSGTTMCKHPDLSYTPTEPSEAYHSQIFGVIKAASLRKCKESLSLTKQIGNRGTFGTLYLVKKNGRPVVYKVCKFEDDDLGYEAFKWESLISDIAGKVGIGPAVVSKQVCTVKDTPVAGILGLDYCRATMKSSDLSKRQCHNLYELIQKMHRYGIAHRDLSLDNLMVVADDIAIIDYGLAFLYPVNKVPRDVQIIDYVLMAVASDSFKEFIVPKLREMKKDAKLFKDAYDEIVKGSTSKKHGDAVIATNIHYDNYPPEMLDTLEYDEASCYLNRAKGKTAKRVDALLENLYKANGRM